MKKVILLVGVLLCTLVVVQPSEAVLLSPYSITPGEWTPANYTELLSTQAYYNFSGNVSPDGYVVSKVYQSTHWTPLNDVYLYTYQIFATQESVVSGFRFDFGPDLATLVSPNNEFWIPPVTGVTPFLVDYTDGIIRATFLPTTIQVGGNSVEFGFFGPTTPHLVTFAMLDSGAQFNALGQIYSPVPEPGTLILLGSGLLGLAFAGGRKKFRK